MQIRGEHLECFTNYMSNNRGIPLFPSQRQGEHFRAMYNGRLLLVRDTDTDGVLDVFYHDQKWLENLEQTFTLYLIDINTPEVESGGPPSPFATTQLGSVGAFFGVSHDEQAD